MAALTCKICGGTLEVLENTSVAICEHCGRKQTLPKLDDEARAKRYDRANHHRRNNDYDKAMGLYESILDEDTTDAEAYWSIVLCRYGIVYVADSKTGKHIPTMNRVQYTSILTDEDYKSALKYADTYQRLIYEEDAQEIYQIQKRFLEISQKEDPFDVFISYKDKDDLTGQPTQDRAIAMEIYNRLHREGLKVFFSHFTLDNKLGEEFEPYIFSALNSAKVMIVLGTKKEYFDATWVRNEWCRFHALIQNGAKKTLIAAYKNMDAYDLPTELDMQAQDMDKMGFLENLVYVVCKHIEQYDTKRSSPIKNESAGQQALLERGYISLEDQEWKKADDFFEKVLNIDTKNAQAYLGKLLAELRVSDQEDLKNCEPFDQRTNYKRLLRYADEELKTRLKNYLEIIKVRKAEEEREQHYQTGLQRLRTAASRSDCEEAIFYFKQVPDYKDSEEQIQQCRKRIDEYRKDEYYNGAKRAEAKGTIESLEAAEKAFLSISDWRDSAARAVACRSMIVKIQEEEEALRLKQLRTIYEQANSLYQSDELKDVNAAISKLESIMELEEARLLLEKCKAKKNDISYDWAIRLSKNWAITSQNSAIAEFESIKGWRDSEAQIAQCKKNIEKIIHEEKQREKMETLAGWIVIILLLALAIFAAIIANT